MRCGHTIRLPYDQGVRFEILLVVALGRFESEVAVLFWDVSVVSVVKALGRPQPCPR